MILAGKHGERLPPLLRLAAYVACSVIAKASARCPS